MASCNTALQLDPSNRSLTGLLHELQASSETPTFGSLKARAAARFAAGHIAAADTAFGVLATWPGAPVSDRAVAAGNCVLCLQHLSRFDAALAAAERALGLVLEATVAGSLHISLRGGSVDVRAVTTAVCGGARTLEADGAPAAPACSTELATVAMKVLTRAATCQAHLRRSDAAATLYHAAAAIATDALHDSAAAAALAADAQHVIEQPSGVAGKQEMPEDTEGGSDEQPEDDAETDNSGKAQSNSSQSCREVLVDAESTGCAQASECSDDQACHATTLESTPLGDHPAEVPAGENAAALARVQNGVLLDSIVAQ